MFNTFFLKPALIGVGATVLPYVIKHFLVCWHKRRLKRVDLEAAMRNEKDPNYYHCMFMTPENFNCRSHIINHESCGEMCSEIYFLKFLHLLRSAKHSISMCMYHLTLKQVSQELINARLRGVSVRIITDAVTAQSTSACARSLKEENDFEVRMSPHLNALMHHKFCVVDAEDSALRKVFFGSLNLTFQGMVANFEFVVITNHPYIVEQYAEQFNMLWNEFPALVIN